MSLNVLNFVSESRGTHCQPWAGENEERSNTDDSLIKKDLETKWLTENQTGSWAINYIKDLKPALWEMNRCDWNLLEEKLIAGFAEIDGKNSSHDIKREKNWDKEEAIWAVLFLLFNEHSSKTNFENSYISEIRESLFSKNRESFCFVLETLRSCSEWAANGYLYEMSSHEVNGAFLAIEKHGKRLSFLIRESKQFSEEEKNLLTKSWLVGVYCSLSRNSNSILCLGMIKSMKWMPGFDKWLSGNKDILSI